MPVDCSWLAEAISATMSATCLIEAVISVSEVPAWFTRPTPSCTWLDELVIRSLMSLAACEERCARLRTSEATTAKPRPASPARRRLDRGVERQQVGLPRDLVDHPDDVGDLARALLDPRHRAHRLGHHRPAAVG